jgi:maleate isomerase
MRESAEAVLHEILGELISDVGASRCTLRLDLPERGLAVNAPAAEAVATGVSSVASDTDLDQWSLSTVQWLQRHKRILVQDDLSSTELQVPAVLTDTWGVKAQMLGPIVRADRLVGWISVHQVGRLRHWSADDEAALSRAVDRVEQVL